MTLAQLTGHVIDKVAVTGPMPMHADGFWVASVDTSVQ
jgi:hypothetical protein